MRLPLLLAGLLPIFFRSTFETATDDDVTVTNMSNYLKSLSQGVSYNEADFAKVMTPMQDANTMTTTNDTPVKLYLYNNKTEPNKPDLLDPRNSSSMSNINSNAPTKIIFHGFLCCQYYTPIQNLKNAYLNNHKVYNVILVDWSEISGRSNFCTTTFLDIFLQLATAAIEYYKAVKNTQICGEETAKVLLELVYSNKLRVDNFHFLGHSLGAHCAGYCARYIYSSLGLKPPRITTMDPAGPLYTTNTIMQPVSCSDADWVDNYSTNRACFGSSKRIGHVNFLVYGGYFQPSCQIYGFNLLTTFLDFCYNLLRICDASIDNFACSHSAVVTILADSILTAKTALKNCPNEAAALTPDGIGSTGCSTIPSNIYSCFGANCNSSMTGLFYAAPTSKVIPPPHYTCN